jgi:hypothetical protein
MIQQKNVVSQYRTAHNKIIPLALYKSPQDTVAEVHVQGKEKAFDLSLNGACLMEKQTITITLPLGWSDRGSP